jgi:hypothetical protein
MRGPASSMTRSPLAVSGMSDTLVWGQLPARRGSLTWRLGLSAENYSNATARHTVDGPLGLAWMERWVSTKSSSPAAAPHPPRTHSY